MIYLRLETSWSRLPNLLGSRNPDRERVPKGFDKSFTFDLLDVADGSAIPKMEWRATGQQQSLPGFDGDMTIELDPVAVVEEFDGNFEFDVQCDLEIELDHNDALKNVIEVYDFTVIDEQVSEALAICRNSLDEMLEKGADIAGGEVPPLTECAVSSAHNFLKRRPTLSSSYKFSPAKMAQFFWNLKPKFGTSP